MNTQADNQTLKDGIVTAIGLLVLLIGTSTGNALVLLVMSLVGLVGMLIVDRQRWGRTTWLAMTASATIAAVTAIAITMFV
ncbi:MAG: hypothetical protein KDA93_21880 [Planctomycetaceae bacterium]|nr:hypothetical protein [Planctomycetaceae bacterium]